MIGALKHQLIAGHRCGRQAYARRWLLRATPVLLYAFGGIFAPGSAIARSVLPSVSALSHRSDAVAGGASVAVRGRNFSRVIAVRFGSARGTHLHVVSKRKLTVSAPRHAAGVVDVVVITKAGRSTKVRADKFTYRPPPSISAVTPSSGPIAGGTAVTIKGEHFSGIRKVLFGAAAGANLRLASSSTLVVTAPARRSVETADVTVVGAYGASRVVRADRFTWLAPPVVAAPPEVTGVSPGAAPAGYGGSNVSVTLTGTSFSGATSVMFGNVPSRQLYVLDDTALLVIAPVEIPGTIVDVRVSTSRGTSAVTGMDRFAYTWVNPTITRFHAFVAVPSDKTADGENGTDAVESTITAVNGWFATQTNGGVQPRWLRDTSGQVVVTDVDLPSPSSTYAAEDDQITTDLYASGAVGADEFPVVFIDAGATTGPACALTFGGSFTSAERASVLFESACGIYPATGTTYPSNASYVISHEMTHAFGAVPSCAPHYDGTGHVNDNPSDVVYQGSQRNFSSVTLDPGHDDYYDTTNPSCPGIEYSSLWMKPGETP